MNNPYGLPAARHYPMHAHRPVRLSPHAHSHKSGLTHTPPEAPPPVDTPRRRPYNNPGIIDSGIAANRRRASRVGQRQAEQARRALRALDETTAHPLQLAVLRQRANNPTASLRECAATMTPPMSKDAFAAHLRRALRTTPDTDA